VAYTKLGDVRGVWADNNQKVVDSHMDSVWHRPQEVDLGNVIKRNKYLKAKFWNQACFEGYWQILLSKCLINLVWLQ